MATYINGVGAISPQKTWGDEGVLLSAPVDYPNNYLSCIEPDYTQYIDPKYLRRMSRILKMGVTASIMALKEAEIAIPNGIITGTGYGCLEDTGIFLRKMVKQKEQALNPTPFIQSTHNTIGSQIALLFNCQGYNQTYSQEAFSFENSVEDASLQLSEYPDQTLLVGGVDEFTDLSLEIQKRFGIFRTKSGSSLNIFKEPSRGILPGEGALYFALSGKKAKENCASIDSIETFFDPTQEGLLKAIQQFMITHKLKKNNIDLVLVGKSGDQVRDLLMNEICNKAFGTSRRGVFKHLCGEYSTASAFAVWLGARIIQYQHIPSVILGKPFSGAVKNVLIYNSYFENYHSLTLLRSC